MEKYQNLLKSIRNMMGVNSDATTTGSTPSTPRNDRAAASSAPHRSSAIIGPLEQVEALLQSDSGILASAESLFIQLRDQHHEVVEYVSALEDELRKVGPDSVGDSSQLLLPMPPTQALERFSNYNSKQEKEMLPALKAKLQEWLDAIATPLANSARTVQQCLLDSLTSISTASVSVRRIEEALPAYSQGQRVLDSSLRSSGLFSLPKLSAAFPHILHEIALRKAFRKLFEEEVRGMSDRMVKVVADERNRREKFWKQYGHVIPTGTPTSMTIQGIAEGGSSNKRVIGWVGGFGALVAHLQQMPPIIDLGFQDFDSSLPELDPSTLPPLPPPTTDGEKSSTASSSKASPISHSGSSHNLQPPPLPVIEEAMGDSNSPTNANANGATSSNSPISAALSTLHTAFPWIDDSRQLAETRAELNATQQELKQLRATSIAASIHTSPPQRSRSGSVSSASPSSSSSSSSASAGTSSSTSSSSGGIDYYRKWKECSENAKSLEIQLGVKLSENESLRKTNQEKNEEIEKLSKGSARKLKENNTLQNDLARMTRERDEMKAQMLEFERRLNLESEALAVAQEFNARKVALSNFTLNDYVLFRRRDRPQPAPFPSSSSPSSSSASASFSSSPSRSPPVIYEAINIGAPHYFLSPTNVEALQDSLRAKARKAQEEADARMVQQLLEQEEKEKQEARVTRSQTAASRAPTSPSSTAATSASSTSAAPSGPSSGPVSSAAPPTSSSSDPFSLPDYVLGCIIVETEKRVPAAGESVSVSVSEDEKSSSISAPSDRRYASDERSDTNRYNLPPGTIYRELTVELAELTE